MKKKTIPLFSITSDQTVQERSHVLFVMINSTVLIVQTDTSRQHLYALQNTMLQSKINRSHL